MRTKKILSLILAAMMLMSFSASAGSVMYYQQDFNSYSTEDELKSAITFDGTYTPSNKTVPWDMAAFKASGNRMIAKSNAPFYNSDRWEFVPNLNGDMMIITKHRSYELNMLFVPENTWDGSVKTNESFVITFDAQLPAWSEYSAAGGVPTGYVSIVGNTAAAGETAAYARSRVMNIYPNNINLMFVAAGTNQYSGANVGFTAITDVKKVAVKFKYSAGSLTRKGYSDGVLKTSETTGFELEGLKTIDGIGYHHYTPTTYSTTTGTGISDPGFTNFKIYSIDDTEGFKVISAIDATRVPTTTSGTVIKFTQPIYGETVPGSAITMKKDGAEFTDFTVGAFTTTVDEATKEIVSSMPIQFGTLENSSVYEICVANTVKNEMGEALTDSTITFETERPALEIGEITFAGLTVGNMGSASVDIRNNSAIDKNVAVIYAIYAADGTLEDVVYSNSVAVGNETTTTISAGVKLSANAAKAKVMLWDGISAFGPWQNFASSAIAE